VNAILGPLAALSPEDTLMEVEKEMCRRSLAEFVRRAWHESGLEPVTQPLLWDWPLDAVCEHLEAVSRGKLSRLLINVPPGSLKSLLCNVFWPAWEWGPLGQPYQRVIGAAHNMTLATRDAIKMRRLITSDWFHARWPITLIKDTETKFETAQTGFRAAFPATSITGERGDRLIFDDPHSVDGAKSDTERGNVTQTFREALQTRLNNPDRSAIVVIMQRLHQDDVSGVILKDFPEFTHLMLPMRFEPSRRCKTKIGFVDPRMEEGDLLFPSRFPAKTVAQLERGMGVYAAAGQLQQRPEPRGGGILKRTSWSTWDEKAAEELGITSGRFPPFDFIAASIDTAYTEKEENDQSAITIWGVFRDKKARPQLMLVYAWAERVEFNDLVEKIEALAKKWRVDELWIESKAAGISVAQEIRRRMDNLDFRWVTHLIDPGRIDKQARAYAVQGILDSGDVWAPATRWADLVINQCAVFPKGSHDDLVDTVTQALRRFRAMNFLPTDREDEHEITEMKKHVKRERPLYDA